MAGECGTSGTNGVKYYYYKCGGAKRRLGCKRKAVKKRWIERAAVIATIERVLRDDEIDRIADAIIDLQNQEDTTLPALRQQLKDCEQGIENMLNAIQMGILTPSTKTRLEELESQRESLKVSILQAELEKPKYTKEQIVSWINRFKYGNVDDIEYQRQIIDTFINAIYVYDDKLVFTYNFKDGTETVPLKAVEDAFGSDLTQVAPPFLSEDGSFQTFFLSNLHKFMSNKGKQRGNSSPILLPCVKAVSVSPADVIHPNSKIRTSSQLRMGSDFFVL